MTGEFPRQRRAELEEETPPLTTHYQELAAALRAEQRHIAGDVSDIKSDLREMRAQVASLGGVLAALPAQYVTSAAFERMGERIAGEIKAIGTRFEGEVRALAERVDKLEQARDRASGGAQWVWVALGIAFTLSNILIASKGKLW